MVLAATFAANGGGSKNGLGSQSDLAARSPGRKLPELLHDCYDIGGGKERCLVTQWEALVHGASQCHVWYGTVKRGCIVR